jgi:F-type H+-transporting ATPase subunit alpha
MRLDYAQFAELEIFTRFGATVEAETQKKIERGRRIREILKQGRLSPLAAGEEVLMLLAIEQGIADGLPVENLAAFKKALRVETAPRFRDLCLKIEDGQTLEEDEWKALAEAVEKTAERFRQSEQSPTAPEGGQESDAERGEKERSK